jgi:hypothetical protein
MKTINFAHADTHGFTGDSMEIATVVIVDGDLRVVSLEEVS